MKKNMFTQAQLRPFLWLWASQSISAMGTAMTDYALVIWAYEQTQAATSLTLLTLCSFLPTILFRFLAGAAADKWNKKAIMLAADAFAACGSLLILSLYAGDALSVMWLYGINFLLSLMNAFQVPAAYVATSLLVPREYYTRTGGLQAVSGALISILSPVLGSVLLSFGGLEAVLAVDLATFLLAFVTLCFLPIPVPQQTEQQKKETLRQTVASGFCFLRQHAVLWRLILLIAFVNFLAKLGADGQLPAFILSRTENNHAALGAVQAAVAMGLMAGGSAAALLKEPKDDTGRILLMCGMIFLTGIFFALSQSTVLWCIWAFLQYLFAAVMNVYWGSKMRTDVPIHMQGRVFATRDTLQNCTIPLGLYLGGVLCDRVFEPAMAENALLQQLFSPVLGQGHGAGIALLFLTVSVIGFAVCTACLWAHCKRTKTE